MTVKYIGAAVLLVLSLGIGKVYERYSDRALSEMSELLRMLLHIKNKISTFLCPQSSLLSDFESDILTDSGFLCAVREGKTLASAYKSARLSVPKKDGQRLLGYFEGFGKSYKGEELSRTDAIYRELYESYKSESERAPKDVKIVKTLLIAAALGICVLML